MAAALLSLPETEFCNKFHQLLQSLPSVHTKEYIGPTTSRRSKNTLQKRITTRTKAKKEKQKDLTRSQQSTKQRAAKEAKILHNTIQSKSSTTISKRQKPRITTPEFYNKLTAILSRSNMSSVQASQIVQKFKMYQTQYVNGMSLEDIDEFANAGMRR